jgi:thiamine pyrophosphokinase
MLQLGPRLIRGGEVVAADAAARRLVDAQEQRAEDEVVAVDGGMESSRDRGEGEDVVEVWEVACYELEELSGG